MLTTLFVGSLTQLVACVTFAVVARELVRRPAVGPEAHVLRAFAVTWGTMAAYMGERGIVGVVGSLGSVPFSYVLAGRYVETALVSAAAWGISYYVAFLYTGRRGLRTVFFVYFLVVGFLYAWFTAQGHPTGVAVGPWSVDLTPPTPHIDIVFDLFGVPMIVATVLYLSLSFRDIRPIQRYRIVMVSVSLLFWIGAGLVASLAATGFGTFLSITLMGIITAFAVLLAYKPPGFVTRRWPEPMSDEPTVPDEASKESRPDARAAAI